MLSTVLLFVFIQVNQAQSVPLSLVDMDVPIQSGWKCEQRSDSHLTSVRYRRPDDGASFSLDAWEYTSGTNLDLLWRQITITQARDRRSAEEKALPSKWSLGDRAQWDQGPGAVTVMAMSGKFFVRANVLYRGAGERGKVNWRKADPDADKLLVEGAVRHAVARLTAQSFAVASNASVNGRSVSGCLRSSSGELFVPIDGWASAYGGTPATELRTATAALAVRGHSIKFALATNEVRLDGDRRSLSAPLVRRGDRWYVPLASIENAVR